MTNPPHAPRTWDAIRSDAFHPAATDLIRDFAPAGPRVLTVEHLRSAHYAAYKVRTEDGADHVVRIGVLDPAGDAPVDNSGFAGTSAVSPAGQLREMALAEGFGSAGASVVVPAHYVREGGLDALWMPFVAGDAPPITAGQWHAALAGLQAYRPDGELPVFTNRAKTFARLDALPETVSIGLRNRYDTFLEALFEAATQWSVVHGDAHAGNAIVAGGAAVLYDFDTACWAPSVWDLTHLLNRAGTGQNTGYTAAELLDLFPFTAAEVEAAQELRTVAAEVARAHREHAALAATPATVRAAA